MWIYDQDKDQFINLSNADKILTGSTAIQFLCSTGKYSVLKKTIREGRYELLTTKKVLEIHGIVGTPESEG